MESEQISSLRQTIFMNFDPPKQIDLGKRPVLKIAVMGDGGITVDGVAISIELLRTLLKSHAQSNGVVWYYREDPQSKASPEAMAVVRSIAENRLAVRLSSRPDYSDSIGRNGKPIGTDGKPASAPHSSDRE
jgi:hypothetical protein